MEFTLVLCNNNGDYIVNIPHEGVGLDKLDAVRDNWNLPHLLASQIAGSVLGLEIVSIEIPIGEHHARESGLFHTYNRVAINITHNLNHYAKEVLVRHDGRYQLKYIYSKDAMLLDWIKAGYPKEWDGKAPITETEGDE